MPIIEKPWKHLWSRMVQIMMDVENRCMTAVINQHWLTVYFLEWCFSKFRVTKGMGSVLKMYILGPISRESHSRGIKGRCRDAALTWNISKTTDSALLLCRFTQKGTDNVPLVCNWNPKCSANQFLLNTFKYYTVWANPKMVWNIFPPNHFIKLPATDPLANQ